MAGTSIYQATRTVVKKRLKHVVDLVGMEYAIRASTPVPIDEVQEQLGAYLADHDFHVVHETDVKEIHNQYKLDYPEYRILKVAHAETVMECPMASTSLKNDAGTSVFLPPSVVIYELDGKTHVSAVRPSTLLALFDDPEIREIIEELETVLWDALAEGVPESTMLSEEPPVVSGDRRSRIKKLLHPILGLLDAEYSIHVSTDAPMHEVKSHLRDALSIRGQKVLGEVANGGILLVVNPGQAHKALAIDPDIGVFAPLSVGVYEAGGRTHVRAVRPSTLLIFFDQPAMQEILLEMEMLLWNAITEGVPDATVHSRQPPLPPGTGQHTSAGGLPGGLGSARDL